MLKIEYTNQFKRDLKLSKKRKKNLDHLKEVMQKIINQEPLPNKLKDHALSSNWKNHRELHLEPDWLLIYFLVPTENIVRFVRTGTHSDLFE